MRREDREIKQLEGIVDVLSRCDTMRLGIADADAPYIVPLSFGYELLNGRIAVYFHGAQEGRKAELLRSLPRVCVEADLCHGFPYNGKGGYTCDYESVIGWGDIELLSGEDAEKGVRLLLEHCGVREEACPRGEMAHTNLYRVILDEATGKHRNFNG
jgi:nitroimidazol reductase NimA-like FMN-containing flavoprotein (pyridoxamine 5'-phosphate oxidase superfamily)